MSAFDREYALLERDLEEGSISQKEFNDLVREMERDERAYAEEQAQRAYDDVMQDHGFGRY